MKKIILPAILFIILISTASIMLLNYTKDYKVENDLIIEGKGVEYSNITDCSEKDALTLINKWYFELTENKRYDLYAPLKLACIIDPFLHSTYENLDLDNKSEVEKIQIIQKYCMNNFSHLQAYDGFQKYSSKMPWGRYGLNNIYKRLLPSEMKAMGIYTGKISGACESLTYFYCGLLRIAGLNSENVVSLRTTSNKSLFDNHTIAIAKFQNHYYYINNTQLSEMNIKNEFLMNSLVGTNFFGIFGDEFFLSGKLRISKDIFNSEKTLLESIEEVNNVKTTKIDIIPKNLNINNYEELKSYFFNNFKKEHGDLLQQIKYAYQSIYVNKPYLYLKASLKGPLAKKMSKEIKTQTQVLNWINNNIGNDSIFIDGNERVLTADQVLVYKTGTSLDKAILAYTLLKHNKINATIEVKQENVFLITGEGTYFMGNFG